MSVNVEVELTDAETANWTYGKDAIVSLNRVDYGQLNAVRTDWIDRWNELFGAKHGTARHRGAGMTGRRLGWLIVTPATLTVVLLPGRPVGDTFSTTFAGGGFLALDRAFFGSRFRRAVLLRNTEIALVTTALSVLIIFVSAWVVSRAPDRWKSVLIIAAVFPALTGVIACSFAWLVLLGRKGIMNATLMAVGLTAEALCFSIPRAR